MERKKKGRTAGTYYMPMLVDMAILEKLPREGTMLGFHPIAVTVPALTNELNDGVPRELWVAGSQVTGRMTSMQSAGLVVQMKLLAGKTPGGREYRYYGSSGTGWQRTAKGEEVYAEFTGKTLAPTNGTESKAFTPEDEGGIVEEVEDDLTGGGQ